MRDFITVSLCVINFWFVSAQLSSQNIRSDSLKSSIKESILKKELQAATNLIALLSIQGSEEKNDRLIADADFFQSEVDFICGDYSRCVANTTKAFNVYKRIQDYRMMIYCLLNYTEIFYNSSNYITAERYSIEALKLSKDQKYLELEILSRIWVALNLHAQNNYIQASEYNEQALKLNEQLKSDSAKNYAELIENNLGADFMEAKNFGRAKRHFWQALKKVSASNNQPEVYSKLLDNIAQVNIAEKKFDSVLKLLMLARSIRIKHNILREQNINSILLSDYYFSVGDTLKARWYATDAIALTKKYYSPSNWLLVLKQIIKTDKKRSQIFALEYIKIKDSLEILERGNRNKFARIAYETDEIIKQKDQAEKEKKIALAGTGVLLLFGACAFIIRSQRARQKEMVYIQEQQKSNEAIYQLIHNQQQKIEEGRNLEKKRIAGELHDGIMNRLASTRLNLFILDRRRDAATIEQCLPHIDGIRHIEQEIRKMAHDLQGGKKGIETSFSIVLDKFFEEQRKISQAEIHTNIEADIDWVRIDSSVKINLYRILQEALQNSFKYANAKNIYITIKEVEKHHQLIISDDGVGFKSKQQRCGIGLKNMKQRTKALSGTFKICSQPGQGTTILINIPIKEVQNDYN